MTFSERILGVAGAMLILVPMWAEAQTYTRTETISYDNNTARWVIGQVKRVACVAPTAALPAGCGGSGVVISDTSYDALARPVQTSSFGKVTQTLTYHADGTLATVRDGNGNVTALTDWKRGLPRSIRFPGTTEAPAGSTRLAAVNDAGWVTSITDENGYLTGYSYDAMGRLSGITWPSGDTTAWKQTSLAFHQVASVEYGIAAGHWRQTVSTGNARRITYFDALWRPLLTREYDAANEAGTRRFQRFSHDHEGRVTFASYPASIHNPTTGTWTGYDALGRKTSVAQDSELSPSLLVTSFAYLGGLQTRVTNPRGQQTTTRYLAWEEPGDAFPVQISHPEGAYTHIGRDVFGKPIVLRRSNSSSPTAGTLAVDRSYAYNAQQELCRSVEPETGATLMGYDGAGNLKWSSAGLPAGQACEAAGTSAIAAARRVDRSYDARNRLVTMSFAGAGLGNQSWSYSPDGLPVSITTRNDSGALQNAVNRYQYNRRRLLTRETLAFAGALNWGVDYAYDGNGHLASHAWHGITVDYAPNALGQPTKAGIYANGVKYHPNGGIREFTYGNGIQHTLSQNLRGLPAGSCDFFGSCTASAILHDSYRYDQNGNVAAIVDGRTGQRGNRTMAYDALDRLTRVASGTQSSPMFGTATYVYDVLDNLTRTDVSGGVHVRNHYYCYGTDWRLRFVRAGQACTGDASGAFVTFEYEVQGNRSVRNNRTYSFDYGNRLRSTTSPATSYAYDGHGRRVLDQVGAAKKYSHYLRDGSLSLVGDERAGKVSEYIYLQGSLVAIRERDVPTGVYTSKYQHTDALGSPVAVTDQSRSPLERTYYEPYGLPDRPWRDGPGYTGHVEDAATQLAYMQQRYYDPAIGRFLSVDPVAARPIGDNFNRYWYANNNPYKFIDPDGRETGAAYRAIYNADSGNFSQPQEMGEVAQVISDVVVSVAIDTALGGPSGEGVAIFSGIRGARAAANAADKASDAKPLMGRNAKPGGSRTNTDAGPNGNRATAKSVFRNQAEGERTTTQMSNGGTRTRAENGVQVRHNPDGSSRVDLPNRGSAPQGESLHTPPPPPPPPPPRIN